MMENRADRQVAFQIFECLFHYNGSKPTFSLRSYCLQITLQRRLHALAPGLTARRTLEKFAAVQMIDVHLPTTDGRELLTRYTQPEPELGS